MLLPKSVGLRFKQDTFPSKIIPPDLACPTTIQLDIAEALFLLGEVTIPNGLSLASPARYWAWVRYFSAIAQSPDLRITAPFLDLDPHQKTILSDDFGVALSMRWLFDRLNGIAEVVDGRRFVLQYKRFLSTPKGSTPKVGAGKCPDFVIRDTSGKWHVIECKGTQSGNGTRNGQMKVAVSQKACIEIHQNLKGHSLASGVVIAGEVNSKDRSEILIADPETDSSVMIDPSRNSSAEQVARRLTVSRAVGLAGIGLLAEELSLPPDVGDDRELFTEPERFRLSQPRPQRESAALREIQQLTTSSFSSGGINYRGQVVEFKIPGGDFYANTGCSRIRIRQGVNEEFVGEIAGPTASLIDEVDTISTRFLENAATTIESIDKMAVVRQGNFFVAELSLLQ